MKATDLMVGNIVKHPDGYTMTVFSIGDGYVTGVINVNDTLYDSKQKIENLSPIPITEELLVKNGFNKDENWFFINIGNAKLCIVNLLGIRESLETPLWRIIFEGVIFSPLLNKATLETSELHRLQNLLNIMNIKLDFIV